jgi:hypothetical protein
MKQYEFIRKMKGPCHQDDDKLTIDDDNNTIKGKLHNGVTVDMSYPDDWAMTRVMEYILTLLDGDLT